MYSVDLTGKRALPPSLARSLAPCPLARSLATRMSEMASDSGSEEDSIDAIPAVQVSATAAVQQGCIALCRGRFVYMLCFHAADFVQQGCIRCIS